MTAPVDAPAAAPGRLEELIARLKAATIGKLQATVTDEDVAWLVDLPTAEREDAIKALQGVGVQRKPLNDRIKEEREERSKVVQIRPRPPGEVWRFGLREDKGGVTPTPNNLRLMLNHLPAYAGRMAFDLMGGRPCLDGRILADHDLTRIQCDVERDEGVAFGEATIAKVAILVSRDKPFHPVAQYLRSHRWDEQPRIATAARDHLNLADPLSNLILKNTLVAAAARGLVHEFSPRLGTMVKTVTILLGRQDAKKSYLWRTLGGEHYGESEVDIGNRHGLMTLHSKWINELQEIGGLLSTYANEKTKGFISRACDDYVPMFGLQSLTFPRAFILVGTENKEKILTDSTGSTRYHVLDTRHNGSGWSVDRYKLAAVRDQLFAEATREVDLFLEKQRGGVQDDKNPHRWWLDTDENALRAEAAEAYTVANPIIETVGNWLAGNPFTCQACRGAMKRGLADCDLCHGRGKVVRGPLPTHGGCTYTTVAAVLAGALGLDKGAHPKEARAVADTLTELGWVAGPSIEPQRVKLVPYYQPDRAAGDIDPDEESERLRLEEARATVARYDGEGPGVPSGPASPEAWTAYDAEVAAEAERARREAEKQSP